jgi:hypothetical protein
MLRSKLAEKGVRVDDGFGFDVGGHAEIDDKETEKEISVAAANSGSGGSSKSMIRSMEQLVARMLLRRSDTSRSIVNRKPIQFHLDLRRNSKWCETIVRQRE